LIAALTIGSCRKFDLKNYPSVNLWILESMKTQQERLVIYSDPVFTFCQPSNFLPSVVHQKINTGNDLIDCLHNFTDKHVEKGFFDRLYDLIKKVLRLLDVLFSILRKN
jgi:hypothetical protein